MAANKALEGVIQRHYGLVFSTAYRVLGNVEDARDVAQDTFIAYSQKPPQGEVKSLPAWLHRVATNKAINSRSSMIRRTAREHSYGELVSKITDAPIENETVEALDGAIERLPEPLRTPLIEHYYARRTHKEIASDLNVSRQTVTARIDRGIQQLRRDFGSTGVSISVPALLTHLQAEASPEIYSSLVARSIQLAQAAAPHPVTTFPISLSAASYAMAPVIVASVAVAVWMFSQGTNGVKAEPRPTAVASLQEELAGAEVSTEPTILAQADGGAASEEDPTIGQDDSLVESSMQWRIDGNIPPGFPADLVPEGVGPILSGYDHVAIEGVVVSENGEYISGARVTLAATGHVGPEVALAAFGSYRSLNHRYTAITDTLGRYRIEGVAFAGNARISAGTYDFPASSQFIGVSAGEGVKQVNFILSDRGMRLRGILSDKHGQPIEGATIVVPTYVSNVMVTSSIARNITTTDVDGKFALSLYHTTDRLRGSEGSASILVTCPDGSRAVFSNVEYDQDSEVNLSMPISARVFGNVKSEVARPFFVYLSEQLKETYDDRGIVDYALTSAYGAWSDAKGNYTIENVPPGREFKVCAIDYDSSDVVVREDVAELSPGESRQIHIEAANQCVVTGTVVDDKSGEPLPFVRVGYHHSDGNLAHMERAWTDADGRFRIPVSRDFGSVRLYPTYYIAHRSGIRKSIQEFGQDLDIDRATLEGVTLRMPSPVPVTLEVIDETGAPAPDVTVWQQTPSGFTDAKGKINLLLAPPTDSVLELDAEGYLPTGTQIDYENLGDTITVNIERTSGGVEARLGTFASALDAAEFNLVARVIPYTPAGGAPKPEKEYQAQTRPIRSGDYFMAREWLPVGHLVRLTITHPSDPDIYKWDFEDLSLEPGIVIPLGTLE